MQSQNKYYTPKIEEFVEGFKYETKHRFRFDIWDASNPENNKEGKWKESWIENTVPNMDPLEYPYTTTDEEGNTWTMMNEPFPHEDPLRTIKILLENGNIRAKTLQT